MSNFIGVEILEFRKRRSLLRKKILSLIMLKIYLFTNTVERLFYYSISLNIILSYESKFYTYYLKPNSNFEYDKTMSFFIFIFFSVLILFNFKFLDTFKYLTL